MSRLSRRRFSHQTEHWNSESPNGPLLTSLTFRDSIAGSHLQTNIAFAHFYLECLKDAPINAYATSSSPNFPTCDTLSRNIEGRACYVNVRPTVFQLGDLASFLEIPNLLVPIFDALKAAFPQPTRSVPLLDRLFGCMTFTSSYLLDFTQFCLRVTYEASSGELDFGASSIMPLSYGKPSFLNRSATPGIMKAPPTSSNFSPCVFTTRVKSSGSCAYRALNESGFTYAGGGLRRFSQRCGSRSCPARLARPQGLFKISKWGTYLAGYVESTEFGNSERSLRTERSLTRVFLFVTSADVDPRACISESRSYGHWQIAVPRRCHPCRWLRLEMTKCLHSKS